ncbi:MAG: Clp1/GlmU family protein [Armatimonadota bacterium]|nr:Clp1/GlmU family protein [Armatimonadota bacterium]
MEKSVPVWPEPVQEVVRQLAQLGGTVVLLGGVDTGKSTLAAALVNEGVRAGRRVGVIDADVGQSDIGPPAAVGFGVARGVVESLSDIPARAIHFVGGVSPAGHLLPMVVGTVAMARRARACQCDLVVVDTTGLITGRVAWMLKFHKIQALQPSTIVALQEEQELEPVLAPFDGEGGPLVVRLSPAPDARPKSPEVRRERRRQAFHRYLAAAREWVLDRSVVNLWPPVHPAGLPALEGTVCGVLNRRAATLAVGVLRHADPYSLTLLAPLEDVASVAMVQWSDLRWTPEGEEAAAPPANF